MARKAKSKGELSLALFVEKLQKFDEKTKGNLRLPSLSESPPRVKGYAYKYALLLPVLGATGERVFTEDHLFELCRIMSQRFGGCLATAASAHPPLYGFYQPAGRDLEKDYHIQLLVLANPIDASDEFFTHLKEILRSAPLVPQEEILIERYDVRLM